jgi:glycerol-3-phosphate acyltransferase PlsX
MTVIVLDAMGSDLHPVPEIQAAIEASQQFGEEILLTGPEDILFQNNPSLNGQKVRIVNAPAVFKMSDKLSPSMIRKSRNSMAVGIQLIKSGEADAFVTMGNTGGALAHGQFILGRIRGVKRAALTALYPVKNGHCVVLDIGATVECKPENLLQFAVLGSVYAKTALGVKNPRVGLLSNGEESGKGNNLVKEAYPLLKSSGLNFIGNVEGKELFGGEADVVVTDGFTGNILTKSSEAVAKLMTDILREEMTASLRTSIGAFLAKPAFYRIKEMLDPAEIGAVPLLGIDGLIFVGHGRSNAQAVLSAIRLARQSVEGNLLLSIRKAVEEELKFIGSEAV